MYIKFSATKDKAMIFTLPALSLSRIPYLVLSGTTILRVMQTRDRRISTCLFSTKTLDHVQLVNSFLNHLLSISFWFFIFNVIEVQTTAMSHLDNYK